ncbi:MAG: type II toxin-antitoxin system Phd/YefM family antitoxin [Deltaproteobacteria bacterium]|nr:type II toxin-antitoxin system Phd/YefM family antitoxin [Deltaproteobacteria bacterium]
MDRYLNVTEARRELLDLVEHLQGADRVVITKHGQPRAVLVNCERYALLEDLAWVLQDPGRRAALQQGWNEVQRGQLLRPSQSSLLSAASLRTFTKTSARRKKKA